MRVAPPPIPAGDRPEVVARPPVLLFDLDGTLVDSSRDLTTAVARTLHQDGLPPAPRRQVQRMVGDGASKLLERAYAHHRRPLPNDAVARFRGHYERCCLDFTRPYPGVVELLAALAADHELAVVTNKPTPLAERVAAGLGLTPWLRAVVGPELTARPKPAPEHLLTALAALHRRPEEAAMIGDGTTDVLAGRAAGTATVAVLWGFRSRRELAACHPDHLVGEVEELARLLLGAEGVGVRKPAGRSR